MSEVILAVAETAGADQGGGGEGGSDGMRARNILQGVSTDRPYRNAIHQYLGDMITGVGSKGKGLISPRIDRDIPAGRDAPVRTGTGG